MFTVLLLSYDFKADEDEEIEIMLALEESLDKGKWYKPEWSYWLIAVDAETVEFL